MRFEYSSYASKRENRWKPGIAGGYIRAKLDLTITWMSTAYFKFRNKNSPLHHLRKLPNKWVRGSAKGSIIRNNNWAISLIAKTNNCNNTMGRIIQSAQSRLNSLKTAEKRWNGNGKTRETFMWEFIQGRTTRFDLCLFVFLLSNYRLQKDMRNYRYNKRRRISKKKSTF